MYSPFSLLGGVGKSADQLICEEARKLIRFCILGAIIFELSACAALATRDAVPLEHVKNAEVTGFDGIRFWGDPSPREMEKLAFASKVDAGLSLKRMASKGSFDVLAISGGAEDGAFGAGLLLGWGEFGNRPEFDVVTGVSSGALIAPFIFIGREKSGDLRDIFTKYDREDIFSYNARSVLMGAALVDNTPLSKIIEYYVDQKFMQDIARERARGRMLLIGTTNLDAQRPVIWDVGRIAMIGGPEATVLLRKILLASAAVPGMFPPIQIRVKAGSREFDEMHVDGGVTRHVFIAPNQLMHGFRDASGKQAIRKRVFVVRNGRVEPEWQPVSPSAFSITKRSVSTVIKNQGIGDLYRIYASAQRERMEFHLASIPGDISQNESKPFDRNYMTDLFLKGHALGRNGYRWQKVPPGMEAVSPRGVTSRVQSE